MRAAAAPGQAREAASPGRRGRGRGREAPPWGAAAEKAHCLPTPAQAWWTRREGMLPVPAGSGAGPRHGLPPPPASQLGDRQGHEGGAASPCRWDS